MPPFPDAPRLPERAEAAPDIFLDRNSEAPGRERSRAIRARGPQARVRPNNRRASAHPMMTKEVDHLPLSPAAVVSIRLGKKGAMTAMGGFKQRDVRVGQDLPPGFRQKADERIVSGMKHQCRQRNFIDNAGGPGTIVIVV